MKMFQEDFSFSDETFTLACALLNRHHNIKIYRTHPLDVDGVDAVLVVPGMLEGVPKHTAYAATFRVARYERAKRFPNDIIIRYARRNGTPTEWHKVVEQGIGDLSINLCVKETGEVAWMHVVDLHRLRVLQSQGKLDWSRTLTSDGGETYFVALNLSQGAAREAIWWSSSALGEERTIWDAVA